MVTSLADGVYIIQNVLHETFAVATSDKDNEPIVATSIAGGGPDDENTEHWWFITNLRNGAYTLKSWNFGVYAHIDEGTIKTCKNAMPFFIYHAIGEGYLIRSVPENRCWSLVDGSPSAQVSLVVASPPAPNKAWNITRITEFLPRRRRPLENTFFDKNASVVVIDHRANCSATQKLDIVILLTQVRELQRMALKILRSFYDELCQIAEDNTPAVDIRFGAVIYTRDDSSWSLSTAWMDTTEMEFVFDQDASPSSHASYDLNIAMQKAIEMDWREDAAPVVVFFPLIAASPDVRVNTKDAELCRRVKAQHMVLVLDTYPEGLKHYLARNSFFYNLAMSSPHQTVVLPENMMTNWIVASTLYNLEVEALASKLKPYVSSWLDSDILQKQEVLPTSHGAFTSVAPPNTTRPDGLVVGQDRGHDRAPSLPAMVPHVAPLPVPSKGREGPVKGLEQRSNAAMHPNIAMTTLPSRPSRP